MRVWSFLAQLLLRLVASILCKHVQSEQTYTQKCARELYSTPHSIWWNLHSFRMWMNYNVWHRCVVMVVVVQVYWKRPIHDWSGRLSVYTKIFSYIWNLPSFQPPHNIHPFLAIASENDADEVIFLCRYRTQNRFDW